MAAVREREVAEVVATGADPFVRHHLGPAPGCRAWSEGPATVVEQPERRGDPAGVVWGLGPARALGPLLRQVARLRPVPERVLVDLDAAPGLPPRWRPGQPRTWHWMSTSAMPPPPRGEVVVLDDDAELLAFLALAYPGSFARPGDPDVECWLGKRDASGRVVAAGALVRRPDGTGYVRAVSVLEGHRGRGHARDVSAAITRRALTTGSGLATLGVFVDNEPALAVYRGLGYRTGHTFLAGAPA